MGEQEREAIRVPTGERDDLQRTARETGERMGGMDATLGEHTRHLARINGSIGDLAAALGQEAKSNAVMAVSLQNIEATLLTKLTAIEGRVTSSDAWIAERRGGSQVSDRKSDVSTRWMLVIFATVAAFFSAAVMTVLGFLLTAVLTIVVLLTQGQI